jgi:methylenetetrahydrofolate reductase (NADPH)
MRKRAAGADGFFTQPFFDLRLLEVYVDVLQTDTVFWGITPVVSANSVKYWEEKNNVVFPKKFKPTLSWNRAFAKKIVEYVKKNGGNLYFMPIKIDIVEYLEGIL